MMLEDHSVSDLNETHLFHGTSVRNIGPICQQVFTWMLRGSAHGMVHGQGVYFGTTSQMSAQYSYDGNVMFIARVLVGRNQALVKPPPPYDSTSGPNMFVIYEDRNMYPDEYVVYY
jgi:hypothetical protein